MGTFCLGSAPQNKISLLRSPLEKHQSHGTGQLYLVVFLPETNIYNYEEQNNIYST